MLEVRISGKDSAEILVKLQDLVNSFKSQVKVAPKRLVDGVCDEGNLSLAPLAPSQETAPQQSQGGEQEATKQKGKAGRPRKESQAAENLVASSAEESATSGEQKAVEEKSVLASQQESEEQETSPCTDADLKAAMEVLANAKGIGAVIDLLKTFKKVDGTPCAKRSDVQPSDYKSIINKMKKEAK